MNKQKITELSYTKRAIKNEMNAYETTIGKLIKIVSKLNEQHKQI